MVSDISLIINYIEGNKTQIIYTGTFIIIGALLSLHFPVLAPIIAAAAVARPQKLLLFVGTQYSFNESNWHRFSPIVENLTNYRFVCLTLLFSIPSVIHYFHGDLPGWNQFGIFAFIVAGTSLLSLTWSEAFYKKNFYFGRWHVIERLALVLFAILSFVSPVFIPLFLLVYWVIVGQFRYPEIYLTFSWTHSSLQRNMLLILSGFTFVSLFISIKPDMVSFLLLCGFATHYFIPGISKIKERPFYWIRYSNPNLLLLKVYEMGWLSSALSDKKVLQIGKIGEKIKPLLNISLLTLQLGVIFILFSRWIAILIAASVFVFHMVVLLIDGDNFWRWMTIDFAIIAGIVFASAELTLFGNPDWILLSVGFIIFGRAWLKITKLGWLDTPYLEYYIIEAELSGGNEKIKILPNAFQPYASMISTGCRGQFKYLDSNHRLVRTNGTSHNQALHKELRDSLFNEPPSEEQLKNLTEKYQSKGYNEYDQKMGENLQNLFIKYAQNGSKESSTLEKLKKIFSSPAEYYTGGFSSSINRSDPQNIRRVRIYRIDGLWTADGFHETRRKEVLSVEV